MIRYLMLFIVLFCTSCQWFSDSSVRELNGIKFVPMTLENELEVLLVSDARFKKSAAAMAVMVGFLEDPKNAEGLAHYLEHMLFMGTAKYPKHDEYRDYMQKHGGYNNAYTDKEITNYFFQIEHNAFEGGLDRFSQFFIAPKFDERFLEKEKNAVNSEFEKNIKQDMWRSMRLMSWLANPEHPHHKFFIGSKTTLKDVNREQVQDFYKKYYSANNMKLVLTSSLPIEKLRALAKKYFSSIKNIKAKRPVYDDNYLKPGEDAKIYFVKTIAETDELSLVFNIPNQTKNWRSKPTMIVAHLIGYEAEGSLLSYLIQKGWALALNASPRADWRTFGINVTLTKKGRENYKAVIRSIFAYIQFIKDKGYKKHIFEDEKNTFAINLQNIEPVGGANMASNYASLIVDYPVGEFLDRYFLLHDYNTSKYNEIVDELTPERARIYIYGKSEQTKYKEQPFGVEYGVENFISNYKDDELKTIAESFVYPKSNPYIPNDFSLVTNRTFESPDVLIDKSGVDYYVRTDTELGVPKSNMGVVFYSNMAQTPLNYVLHMFFAEAKMEEWREWGYQLKTARYNYSVYPPSPDALILQLSGYSQYLPKLLQDLVVNEATGSRLNRVQISEQLFSQIKNKVQERIRNIEIEQGISRLYSEIGTMNNNKAFHWDEYKRFVDTVTVPDVQKYATSFYQNLYIKVVASGNITREQIEPIAGSFYKQLGATKLKRDFIEERRSKYRLIPEGKKFSMKFRGQNNNNAMLSIYDAGKWSVKKHAKMLVLGELVSPAYFSKLRSEKQLGYIVSASSSVHAGSVGLVTAIQSQNHSPGSLYQQSDQFIQEYLNALKKTLTIKEVNPIIKALVSDLEKKENSLGARHSSFWDESIRYNRKYDIRQKLANELKAITPETLKEFIASHFLSENLGQLTMYYVGQNAHKDKKAYPGKPIMSRKDFEGWPLVTPYREPL